MDSCSGVFAHRFFVLFQFSICVFPRQLAFKSYQMHVCCMLTHVNLTMMIMICFVQFVMLLLSLSPSPSRSSFLFAHLPLLSPYLVHCNFHLLNMHETTNVSSEQAHAHIVQCVQNSICSNVGIHHTGDRKSSRWMHIKHNQTKQNKNAEKNARQMEMFDIETNNT